MTSLNTDNPELMLLQYQYKELREDVGEIRSAITEIRDATKAMVRLEERHAALEEKYAGQQLLEARVRSLEDQQQRFETIYAIARWVGFPGVLAVLYLLIMNLRAGVH